MSAAAVKHCPPLEAWRDDEPGLLPSCVGCGADIRVGQRYAIVGALKVYCVACLPPPTPTGTSRREAAFR